ncbi:MAG: prepilin peptidase [Planctomycetes bacterium]|nr:prepilin peptidase [Planctomycetota bacterium]
MLDDLPPEFLVAWWAVVGLFVGSFLNVCIHRLPLAEETVSKPRRSRCPSCKTTLTWKENVPLLSWLVQRGRCRTCGWRIPFRYPLVEVLNALLWGWVAWLHLPADWPTTVLQSVVLSGLVVATFVDFACFEIPDEVSIGGIVLAPIAALCLPQIHDQTSLARLLTAPGAEHASREGALLACLGGMALGGGILWVIGWIGERVYGRDAMGFGDVKLLAAGGGFVGPGGVVLALMIAALSASVAGLANMLRFYWLVRSRARSRGGRRGVGKSLRVARVAGRYLPFGPYLALGVGIALLHWNDVARLLSGF